MKTKDFEIIKMKSSDYSNPNFVGLPFLKIIEIVV